MPEILKAGVLPKDKEPWWVGVRCRCSNCDAEFRLQTGDVARPAAGGGSGWFTSCPTPRCKQVVEIPAQRGMRATMQPLEASMKAATAKYTKGGPPKKAVKDKPKGDAKGGEHGRGK